MTTNANIQLSKWWTTESAKRAMERAANARRDRIEQMKRDLEQRKQEQHKQIFGDNQ